MHDESGGEEKNHFECIDKADAQSLVSLVPAPAGWAVRGTLGMVDQANESHRPQKMGKRKERVEDRIRGI